MTLWIDKNNGKKVAKVQNSMGNQSSTLPHILWEEGSSILDDDV